MVRKLSFIMTLVLVSFSALNSRAQETAKTVTGVVTDGYNIPIVGATILLEGTNKGMITDQKGMFSFLCSPSSVLKISFMGYVSKEVKVGNQRKLTIKLVEDAKQIDEVLVVAYGTAKKSSYSGSASSVKADALKDIPMTSFENALSGKVSGLQITNSSGEVGSAPSVRIRGIGSMNAGNDPLYVIDGVPVTSGNVGQMGDYLNTSNNAMNSLNPDDIESISVLKDAAASSLYGSRAANGVILITTKKGKSGKTQVSLKVSTGFTPCWATKNYEAANTEDQVKMLYMVFHDYKTASGHTDKEANTYALSKLNSKFNKHGYQFSTGDNTGLNADVTISDYDNSGRSGKYYDWDKAYFRTATYQTYDFSVSGASPTTNYYTSLSYTNDQGRLKVNGFDRISGRLNLSTKVGKFFEFATNANFSHTNTSGYNDSRSTAVNLFMQTRNLLWGLYWPTDYSTGKPWTDRYGSYAYNNLYYDKEWDNSSINNRLTASEAVTLHLLPNLDVRSLLSYDNSTVKDHLYYSVNHFNGSSSNGEVDEMRTIYERIVSSTTANYNILFGKHSLGALVGFEAEKNTTDYTRATGTDLPTSTLHTITTAGTLSADGYNWGNSMISVLSKLDYNYDDKYFASASYRRDGSSRLSKNSRWGDFWSIAGSWNMFKEDFMKDYSYISNLRLRVSYGVNGTLPTDNYGYMNLVTYSSKYMGQPGGTLSTIADNNLSWETSYTSNIGLDFGFWNNRLRGTVEYYNRTSKNLLQDVPISMVTGFSSTLRNIGKINNKGIEVELSGDIVRKKDLTWSASVNASFLSSKVNKLYDGSDIIWYDPTGNDDRAQYVYREGKSTLAFYGYEWAGVDKSNGNSVYYVNDPNSKTAGDFIYKGRGATYSYKKANYSIIGNAVPDVYGGINTNVKYKGIDLSLNFSYKIGGDIYDGAYKDVADDGYYWERIRAKSYFKNMWTAENPNGSQPRIQGVDLEDAQQYSSRHICNASYLRLKSLSLGYTLPHDFVQKVWINDARAFFNATNLLTFSKYKEADPEVNSYGTRGWETPIGKTFVFGIDLKF
ncbi:MAG: TonB-dependent receptor [Bacteroidaceae bacterium]